jgi:sphinganine-1-phosphate aldolase
MYSLVIDWTGGIYASPTQAGSRPGALVAGCWSTLVSVGANGFRENAREILSACDDLIAGLRSIDECEIVGEPALSVVAFTTSRSSGISIFDLMDALHVEGWDLNAIQDPSALHVCITLPMVPRIGALICDIRSAAAQLKSGPVIKSKSSKGSIYGMVKEVPAAIADEVARMYLDEMLAPAAVSVSKMP